MSEVQTQPSAADVFRAAYENRYTWDADFPGFEADFTLVLNDETHTGTAAILKDLSVRVETADAKAQEWLYNQLKDVVVHRKRSSFEAAHSKHTFSFDGEADETGALPVTVGGDAMGSNYKIRDNQVVQVSRTMGRMAFTINHLAKIDTSTGYLSTAYNAVFRNAQSGEVTAQRRFEDTYEEYEGYWVMTRQVVHSREGDTSTVTEITFTNLRPVQ
ncbi:DUF3386 domain-containing protein [Gloeobacter violaceus]|nr:DUF3386 domain-containing protein [Gloeobacter violaceus]